ncbi:type II toxin-antitoxin system HipA family toxin [Paenarthrobacter nitroguajacolicus]|uniref:type II toxin-antitoxin system HipA family toxin n=1 Tax=Paenarthrobacter nitroguajacolicus TaxID=211146 RepID=UPI0015B9898A|nr:HipA domain-containing protein [Paenarthrobacter nitroguajacolicus]NWL33920.1 phosphatidylinositol kinase [Paenarthrobacter nitroguajacolicus]
MTTSNELYVWTWLPGATEPVVAGRVEQVGSLVTFIYGLNYRSRPDAISLFAPELPLRPGVQEPADGLSIPGVLRDGSPDRWGRGVIERRRNVAPNSLSEIDYMLTSSSNRFGALDFQTDRENYVPRDEFATFEELHRAAILLDEGGELSPSLEAAMMHGTSLGGARPKATLTDDDGSEWLAKFSSSDDRVFSVVNAEGAMLELARRAGMKVPESKVISSLGKEVLLVRRFDRDGAGGRRHAVSGLTMAQTDEMYARYVSYPQILDVLREYAVDATQPGPELFRRIALNIAISNNDDHARNHAAFWDGKHLELTPVYDLAPGQRSGDTFEQAMRYGRGDRGAKVSNFAALVGESETYGLNAAEGRDIIDNLVSSIRETWDAAAEVARLSEADKHQLFGKQVLPRAAFFDYEPVQL